MEPVRLILAGLGSWGPGWATLIDQEPGVELAAVVDPMDERRQAVVDTLSLTPERAYADFDEALAQVESDAVLICTPPQTHLALARKAFAAGKDVLMEKPLAASMEDARAIVEAAEASGQLMVVSQNYRYRAPMLTLKAVLEAGEIGDLIAIKGYCQEDMRLFYEPTNFRYLMKHPYIIDMTIHHWDLLRALTGREIEKVHATSWPIPDSPYQHHPACAVLLWLDNGVPVHYEGNGVTHRERTSWSSWWEFVGTKGRLWTDGGVGDPHTDTVHLHIYGQEPEVLIHLPAAPLDLLGSLRAFVDALRGGPVPPTTGRDNLNSLAVVFACVESVERAAPVEVSEFRTS